jgi:nucleotide-binding universal stress UspA family protein
VTCHSPARIGLLDTSKAIDTQVGTKEIAMRIVVGVDESQASSVASELVSATTWPVGTSIRLVTAHELGPHLTRLGQGDSPSGSDGEADRRLSASLGTLADGLHRRGYATETVIARGRAADVLLAEADDLAADLIIVGSRGRGAAATALLGSVSATLVDQAACPVLVARIPSVTKILVATDGSQSAEAIPAVLAAWHVFLDASIDVLAVAPPSSRADPLVAAGMVGMAPAPVEALHEVSRHQVMAGDMAARLVHAGWRAESAVRPGEPAQEIESAAKEWGTDLIITGSRGLSGMRRRLMGSVAHHVLVHARCSVLVMRGHVPARQPRSVPVPSTAT